MFFSCLVFVLCFFFFFFNDTATTEIYTLSLHDALPISPASCSGTSGPPGYTLVSDVDVSVRERPGSPEVHVRLTFTIRRKPHAEERARPERAMRAGDPHESEVNQIMSD